MSVRRHSGCIDQMILQVEETLGFVAAMTEAEFLDDRRTQRAVSANLMAPGETGSKVIRDYPDFAAGNPQIAWHQMRGMRNRIAHGYFELDMKAVWVTVSQDLPPLPPLLRQSPQLRQQALYFPQNSSDLNSGNDA